MPNTLRTKFLGQTVNVKNLELEIINTRAQINNMKLERNAFQMAFLVELIISALKGDGAVSNLKFNLESLFAVAKDTSARLNGSAYDHVADLCASMISVAGTLVDGGDVQKDKNIRLLKPLSEAILLACHPEIDSKIMTDKITGAIYRYQTK